MAAFPRAVTFAHQLIRERLKPGDTVLDATVGNGHDTAFLAKCVGPDGQVFGFDIQPAAIEATTRKLAAEGFTNVILYAESHALISEKISVPVKAAMFNLGYFPGGDKSVITQPESTLAALNAVCEFGAEIITIAVYYGHEGGEAEAAAITDWVESLDQTEFTAIRYEFVNPRNSPPFLIAVERKV